MKHPRLGGKLRPGENQPGTTTMTSDHQTRPATRYGRDAFAARFPFSRETLDRLDTYATLLVQWQKAVNLVAPSTLDDVWHRHFADSAQLLALAPPRPTAWVDLGSGAGFPGLVIAILLADQSLERHEAGLLSHPPLPSPPPSWGRPGGGDSRPHAGVAPPTRDPSPQRSGQQTTPTPPVTLIESDQRKAAFLREVARRTGVSVDILVTRIENAATRFNLPAGGVVSARALASLTGLLRLGAPFLSSGSVGLFLKGREAEAEVAEAHAAWRFHADLVPSVTDPEARVVIVRDFAGPEPGRGPETDATPRTRPKSGK